MASHQQGATIGKEVSPVVNRSISDYPKPIISPNGIAMANEMIGEGGELIGKNRFCFVGGVHTMPDF